MPIHKVTTRPETAFVGVLTSYDDAESKFGAQYKLSFSDGTDIYEKQDAVTRQLTRAGLSLEDAIGVTLKVSRTPMRDDPSKGFLNIEVARGTTAARAVRTPAKVASNAKQPFSAGAAHIPGLDDFDIIGDNAVGETDAEFAARMGASAQPAVAVAPARPAAAARPAPAATLVPTRHEKHEAAQRFFKKDFEWFVAEIKPILDEQNMPYTFDVNACISTVFINGEK